MNNNISTWTAARVLLARTWWFMRWLLRCMAFVAFILIGQRVIDIYWPGGLTNNELLSSIIDTHMVKYTEGSSTSHIDYYFSFFTTDRLLVGHGCTPGAAPGRTGVGSIVWSFAQPKGCLS
jgi:hypothetical protein